MVSDFENVLCGCDWRLIHRDKSAAQQLHTNTFVDYVRRIYPEPPTLGMIQVSAGAAVITPQHRS